FGRREYFGQACFYSCENSVYLIAQRTVGMAGLQQRFDHHAGPRWHRSARGAGGSNFAEVILQAVDDGVITSQVVGQLLASPLGITLQRFPKQPVLAAKRGIN